MRNVILGALTSLSLLAFTIPAQAAVAATGPAAFVAGFATPVVVIAEGEGITYVNADIARHNFIADGVYLRKKAAKKTEWCSAYEKGKCPLFWSDTITAGETTEVRGLERVSAGTQYPFFCSVHPNMKGTLIVR